jgi:hypothetical protein
METGRRDRKRPRNDRGSEDKAMKGTWNRLLGVLADTTSVRADPMRREIRIVLGMMVIAAQEWEGWDDSLMYEKGSLLNAYVAARELVRPGVDPVFMKLEDVLDAIGEGVGSNVEFVVKKLT